MRSPTRILFKTLKKMLNEIKKSAAYVAAQTEDFNTEVGIILGTGLGDFADNI